MLNSTVTHPGDSPGRRLTAAVQQTESPLTARELSKTYAAAERPWGRLATALLRRKEDDRVSKDSFHALKDVSFDLRQGESLGIIGLNGAGKSTLLQIIAGTLQPSSGEIRTKGRIAALLELGSGFNPDFTGKENVYLNASVLGLSKTEIDDKYEDVVSFADIGDFIHQPVRTYSSGMTLRLAFAVLANTDPDILIIDEALAVGDALYVQKCMRFLRSFKSTGNLVLVTHDVAAVQSLCDRCLWLSEGRLAADGSPKEVIDRYLAHVLAEQKLQDRTANPETSEPLSTSTRRASASPNAHDAGKTLFDLDAKELKRGGAEVEKVELTEAGKTIPVTGIRGGERVTLSIQIRATTAIRHPVIGFILRNRLGQDLFSENTYDYYRADPVKTEPGNLLVAAFSFHMPILPPGDYSITVAVAESEGGKFEVIHWVYDVMFVKSVSQSWSTGIVGIPMEKVEVNKHE